MQASASSEPFFFRLGLSLPTCGLDTAMVLFSWGCYKNSNRSTRVKCLAGHLLCGPSEAVLGVVTAERW